MDKIFCYDTDDVTIISHVTQWDINRKIHIKKDDIGVTTVAPEVHFANNNTCKALVTTSSIVGESVEVEIPNILLQERLPIMMYIYVWTDSTSARTKYEIKMPVNPRQKPEDYIFDDNVLYVIGVPQDGSITETKLSSGLLSLINGKLDKSYFDEHTNVELVFNNDDLGDVAGWAFGKVAERIQIVLLVWRENIDYEFPQDVTSMDAKITSITAALIDSQQEETGETVTFKNDQIIHIFDEAPGFREYEGDDWGEYDAGEGKHIIMYVMNFLFDSSATTTEVLNMIHSEFVEKSCSVLIEKSSPHVVRPIITQEGS